MAASAGQTVACGDQQEQYLCCKRKEGKLSTDKVMFLLECVLHEGDPILEVRQQAKNGAWEHTDDLVRKQDTALMKMHTDDLVTGSKIQR